MGTVAGKDESQQVYCPVAATMDLLNEKWTLHIIHTLMSGKKRHNSRALIEPGDRVVIVKYVNGWRSTDYAPRGAENLPCI